MPHLAELAVNWKLMTLLNKIENEFTKVFILQA